MTKKKAIEQMKLGKWVTHRLLDGDAVRYSDGRIERKSGKFEYGFEFWSARDSFLWDDGFSLLGEPEQMGLL